MTGTAVKALEKAWSDFCDANPDDLTSPEDLPDRALMTCAQFVEYASVAALTASASEPAPEGWRLVLKRGNWEMLERLRELIEGDTTFEVVADALWYVLSACPEYEREEGEPSPLETAIERAYGILWRDISRGSAEKCIAARKELFAVLSKDGQRRGIQYAHDLYGPATDEEVLAGSASPVPASEPEPVAIPTQRQMNEAFYLDVCQAEDRLKEFIAAGRKLLGMLPAHWHGDEVIELSDLCDETDAVLNPHMHKPYEVEQATKRYGRCAINPLPTPDGAVEMPRFAYSSVTPKYKNDGTDEIDHLKCWIHTTIQGQDQADLYERAKAITERVNSAALSHPADGWRDIRTAPRDGTKFLAWGSFREEESPSFAITQRFVSGKGCGGWWVVNTLPFYPKLWMPLIAPAAKPEGE